MSKKKEVEKGLWDVLKEIVTDVKDVVVKVVDTTYQTAKAVVSGLATGAETVGATLKKAGSYVASAVYHVARTVYNAAEAAVLYVYASGKTGADWAMERSKEAWARVVDAFSWVGGQVKDAGLYLWSGITRIGTSCWSVIQRGGEGLWAVLRSAGHNLYEAIRTFPRNVRLIAAYWYSVWKYGQEETEKRWRLGEVPEFVKGDLEELMAERTAEALEEGVIPADPASAKDTGQMPVVGSAGMN